MKPGGPLELREILWVCLYVNTLSEASLREIWPASGNPKRASRIARACHQWVMYQAHTRQLCTRHLYKKKMKSGPHICPRNHLGKERAWFRCCCGSCRKSDFFIIIFIQYLSISLHPLAKFQSFLVRSYLLQKYNSMMKSTLTRHS